MPSGRPTGIDSIQFSNDRRTVTATFIGGAAPNGPNDFCSAEYTGWSRIDAQVLELGVFEVPQDFSETPPPNMLCGNVGYARSIDIALPEKFDGSEWHDVRGYRHFLAPPDGLYSFDLPPGWVLLSQRDVEQSPTGRWERVFGPSSGSDSKHTLDVFQSFGGPVNVTGGDDTSTVDVNGHAATLYRHGPSGELVLVWNQDGVGLAVVGNEAEFTNDELIALAGTAKLAGQ